MMHRYALEVRNKVSGQWEEDYSLPAASRRQFIKGCPMLAQSECGNTYRVGATKQSGNAQFRVRKA